MDNKQGVEVILKIVIVFLSVLLMLSVFNGGVTLFMIVGALGATYIFVHYWRKRIVSPQHKKVQVK